MENILIALDQLANVLIWIPRDGWGKPDETLSARAWRLRGRSNAYLWINRLFFWEANHCLSAYMAEVDRKQLPGGYWPV